MNALVIQGSAREHAVETGGKCQVWRYIRGKEKILQTASASVFFHCMVYLYNDKSYVAFGQDLIFFFKHLSILDMGFIYHNNEENQNDKGLIK